MTTLSSATCISSNGENRHLAPTKDFSAWPDYIKQSISSKTEKRSKRNNHRFTVLALTSNKSPVMMTKAVSGNNVFVILGSKQTLSLHEQLSWLATQPARLLFAQIDRASGTSIRTSHCRPNLFWQPFYEIHRPYIQLYRRQQTGKDGAVQEHRSYGCQLIPVWCSIQQPYGRGIYSLKVETDWKATLWETALDSVLWQFFETDSLLLHSLKDYERNIGVQEAVPHPNWRIYSIIRKILTVWALTI